ncbi:MAG: undecaprenyl-diphosphate phosphatase [Terriglobales bacterium]|jgi:undecaprenyl-diphosphatase
MEDYVLSAILGLIEGLTEFLPVSSTAHLRIAEQVFGLDLGSGYWKMYAIVIQLGAILCLPIYFRKRIAKFLSTFPNGERGDRTALTHPLTLVMIAFVVTAAPAFLLTKLIGKHLENLALMAWALIIGGIVMWVVDALYAKKFRIDHMEQMSLPQAVWIGACQILSAVFPGTSRSMSTIAAGQIAGMSREAALEFSFFLSMPTMAAATIYDLLKFLRHGGMSAMNQHEWTILLIGFVVSFFVAWAVVAWFMHWVRRHGFIPFAVYRILAGIVVLVWLSRLM